MYTYIHICIFSDDIWYHVWDFGLHIHYIYHIYYIFQFPHLYINVIAFCVLILLPLDFLSSFIHSRSGFVDSLVFAIGQSCHVQIGKIFFLCFWSVYFLFFSCLTIASRTPSAILNKNNECISLSWSPS